MSAMLSVEALDLYYGDAQALSEVSLEVPQGEIVAIVGANGAGKSSLIRTIAGIERARSGRIRFKGTPIEALESHRICDLGIGQVAEGRQVFPSLTVEENLEMGGLLRRARKDRLMHRRHAGIPGGFDFGEPPEKLERVEPGRAIDLTAR